MNNENYMDKKNKPITEKIDVLTGILKNVKFLVLTVIALAIFGGAIISGNGKDIVLSLYKNVTGEKYPAFSPVQDYSNATYLILKDKLSRDNNIGLEKYNITIFKDSDSLHKYRVEFENEVYLYSVKKNQNGTWHIYKE